MLGFTKKVPSSQATYENFSFQDATGIQVKMTDRWGLRLGLFSDFHFSDAFIVQLNPGLDVMNANLGLSDHFQVQLRTNGSAPQRLNLERGHGLRQRSQAPHPGESCPLLCSLYQSASPVC
jgi:hypothetical protein